MLNDEELRYIEKAYGLDIIDNPNFGIHVRRLISACREANSTIENLEKDLKIAKEGYLQQFNLAAELIEKNTALRESVDIERRSRNEQTDA